MLKRSTAFAAILLFAGFGRISAQDAAKELREQAALTLKKAATFYRTQVARHGGYVYYTSLDLREHWGEGRAGPGTIFVQPPGTPTVGMAFLQAYRATGDKFYLEAATEAAEALVYGQLQSGGWTQTIHFVPGEAKRLGKYRNGKGGSWNASSLDDGQSQSALQFLTEIDRTLERRNAKIHDAATYGLDALLNAQFANGAFPQIWTGKVDRNNKPVVPAKYPDYDWRIEGRLKNYWDYYTLNDNLAGSVAETLIVADQAYQGKKYRDALERLGDFLILAQMPEPQPGWCQQYNYEMIPIWARKFEPPAITAWESQDVLETLMTIARYTGKKKYLEPVPRALAYFKKSVLPDGQVARYYEFKTNKPLYMDASYRLTYDDSAAPSHYGWKQKSRFPQIEQRFLDTKADDDEIPILNLDEVRRIIKSLDAEGRWITAYAGEKLVGQPKFADGFRFLSSAEFSRNMGILSKVVKGKN